MNSRLGGPPSSESRPKETNLGRGRPEFDIWVSIGGGLGTDLLEEIEPASDTVSSSRRAREDDMLTVVVRIALEMQSAPVI